GHEATHIDPGASYVTPRVSFGGGCMSQEQSVDPRSAVGALDIDSHLGGYALGSLYRAFDYMPDMGVEMLSSAVGVERIIPVPSDCYAPMSEQVKWTGIDVFVR